MKKVFYVFLITIACFFCFSTKASAEILYDVTNFRLTDETLTLEGWGLVHWKHNGNLKGGYSNTYKFKLKNSSGTTVREAEYKYSGTIGSWNSWANTLSLTCFLSEENIPGDNALCIEYHSNHQADLKNIDERNKIVYRGNDNYYYDMVDFKVTFNDMNTLPDDEYKISMTIITGLDKISETENELYIIEDYVHNDSKIFDTSKFTGSIVGGIGKVKFMANNAIPRNFNSMNDMTKNGTKLGGISSGCHFNMGDTYNVWSKKKLGSGGYSNFYAYQLAFSSYNGNCSKVWDAFNSGEKAGAYAVWVKPWGDSPIVIKRKKIDPCADGVYDEKGIQIQTAKEYAYSNPGVCCDTTKGYEVFYETCCGNSDLIKSKGGEYLEFCCNPKESEYYNSSTIKLPTFKNPSYYSETKYNELCSRDCMNNDDYNFSNGNPSLCCSYGESGMLNGEAYNKYLENESKCENNCNYATHCSTDDKFNSNYSCCCSLNPADARCNVPDWGNYPEPSYGLKCDLTPSNSNITDHVIAKGTTSSTNYITNEYISFNSYKTLDHMKTHLIQAGTGFIYDLDVIHRVEKEVTKNNYSYCELSYNDAVKEAQFEINGYLDFNNTAKIIDTSNYFKFDSIESDDNYTGVSTVTPILPNGTIVGNYNIEYKYCYACPPSPFPCCDCIDGTFEYDKVKTYDYKYTIHLQNKYINKYQNNDPTNHDDDNIVTFKTTSNETSYIEGENKFYTKITTKTGIYDFNIKLEGASGVTGNLSTVNNGFACQFGVKNEIKENSSECVTLPCPPDKIKDGRSFVFRQISLSDPFPNNRVLKDTNNWYKYYNSTTGAANYITHSGENDNYGSLDDEKGSGIYTEEPMYQVTLDSELIKQIKKYNESKDYNYGWENMTDYDFDNVDSTSNFLSGKGSVSCYNHDTCDKIEWNGKLSKISDTERQNKVGDF